MWKCKHCKKEYDIELAANKANHSRWCVDNPNSCKHKKDLSKARSKKKNFVNQYTKAKQLGLKKPKYDFSKRKSFLGKSHSEETKEKIRQAINKRIQEGYKPVNNRCRKYKYKDFTVDGKWELSFCKWCDKNKISFKRNKKSFEYTKQTDDKAYYFPDFELEHDVFVEVKGYETELDHIKWSQFPHKLIVLRKKQIENLDELTLEDLFVL